MVIRIIAVKGLLSTARLDAEANNAGNLRLGGDGLGGLTLPVGVVASQDAVGSLLEQRVDNQLGRRIRVRQDAVCSLRCRGEEARLVDPVRVKLGLEVLSDTLAVFLGHKTLDYDGAIALDDGLEECAGRGRVVGVDGGEGLAGFGWERASQLVVLCVGGLGTHSEDE